MSEEQQQEHKHEHQHGHDHQHPPGMHPSFLRVIEQKKRVKQKLAGIKNKIGVYSAKGGVGKTTVAVNLAFALSKKGYKVGLLDADIDCPNVTMFLGIEDKKMEPVIPLKPLDINGVKVASTAMLVDEMKRPIIWRGPIVTKMLGDFFENTDWGELDYLICDLSPGTSDGPLTIMQVLELTGFIIVTTPQRIAGINSTRSGMMAKRLGAPIMGVVENMSTGKPSQNTMDVVKTLDTDYLGNVPMTPKFAELTDKGKIQVNEDKEISKAFESIVEKIMPKK